MLAAAFGTSRYSEGYGLGTQGVPEAECAVPTIRMFPRRSPTLRPTTIQGTRYTSTSAFPLPLRLALPPPIPYPPRPFPGVRAAEVSALSCFCSEAFDLSPFGLLIKPPVGLVQQSPVTDRPLLTTIATIWMIVASPPFTSSFLYVSGGFPTNRGPSAFLLSA